MPSRKGRPCPPGRRSILPAFHQLSRIRMRHGPQYDFRLSHRSDAVLRVVREERLRLGLQGRSQAAHALSRASQPARIGLVVGGPASRFVEDVLPLSRPRRRADGECRRAVEFAQALAAPAQSPESRNRRPDAGGANSGGSLSAPRSSPDVFPVRYGLPCVGSRRHSHERRPSRRSVLPRAWERETRSGWSRSIRSPARRSRPI